MTVVLKKYFPAGQPLQTTAPLPDNFPNGQSSQVILETAPIVSENFPSGQSRHLSCPNPIIFPGTRLQIFLREYSRTIYAVRK